MVEWIESREQPVTDGTRARGRKLLPADDGAETLKAGFAAADAGHSGLFEYRNEPRVLCDQRRDAGGEIGIGVNEVGHGLLVIED